MHNFNGKGTINIELGHVLGFGSQGIVYEALCVDHADNRPLFIKCHKVERHFLTEVSFLSALAGTPGVVQLVAVDKDKHAFVGQPICKKLSSFRGRFIVNAMGCQMVDIFAAVHKRGFGHRDARCGNFLVEVDDKCLPIRAIVGDWATAVILNEVQHIDYEGALHFAADCVLRNLQAGNKRFAFTAAMDLESLAKTVWDLSFPTPSGVHLESKDNPGAILEWWVRRAEQEPKLAMYLHCARTLDYNELKRLWC